MRIKQAHRAGAVHRHFSDFVPTFLEIAMKNLEKLYTGFDWYYDRSDDHSVWSRGNAQWQAICREEQRLMLN